MLREVEVAAVITDAANHAAMVAVVPPGTPVFDAGRLIDANEKERTEPGQRRMTHDTALRSDVVPVGSPREDMAVAVVDADGRPLPAGDVGEIAVTSRFLAVGYWKDPGRTARAFMAAAHQPGARTYRTGDAVRITHEGVVEHLGRLDGRLRLAGEWIDPTLVENALVQVDGVAEAVVALDPGFADVPRLVASLVHEGERNPGVAELRRHLAATLSSPLIFPSRYVRVDRLPLTSSGKVDRQRLPAPDRARPALDVAFVAPVRTLHQRLAQIWSEVLGLDEVGILDNFFDLGGNSLLAVVMLAGVERSLGTRSAERWRSSVRPARVRGRSSSTASGGVCGNLVRASYLPMTGCRTPSRSTGAASETPISVWTRRICPVPATDRPCSSGPRTSRRKRLNRRQLCGDAGAAAFR